VSYRVPFDPGDGVECLVCGDVMRMLSNHLKTHGMNASEYRRLFPGAATTGPIMLAIRKDMYIDAVEDGRIFHREHGVCANGHKLTKKNTLPDRSCRECARKRREDWYARNREGVAEYNRAYRAANKERLAEYEKSRVVDLEARRKYQREWARKKRANRRKAA
jgi:hypothetical protein